MALSTTDVLGRIVGPVAVANGTSTVFTGAALHRYTFKNVRIVNTTAGAVTFSLGIGGVAAANLITPAITLAAGDIYDEDCNMLCLAAGETLQALTTAVGLTITVSGLDQS